MTQYRVLMVLTVLLTVAVSAGVVSAQSAKGVELYNSWQFQAAEKVFREELKADPSNTPASYYLGLAVLHQEKYQDALDVFMKVQQQRAGQRNRPAVPSEYQIQLALAQARIGLKQFSEAWKNLEAARNEDAEASDVYVYRGLYYLQQDKPREALKELERAIELDKTNPYAYYYMGLAYVEPETGNPQKAVEALKMFLQLAPSAPEAPKAKLLHDQLC